MVAHDNAEHGRVSEFAQHSHDVVDEDGINNALNSLEVELSVENRVEARIGELDGMDTGTAVGLHIEDHAGRLWNMDECLGGNISIDDVCNRRQGTHVNAMKSSGIKLSDVKKNEIDSLDAGKLIGIDGTTGRPFNSNLGLGRDGSAGEARNTQGNIYRGGYANAGEAHINRGDLCREHILGADVGRKPGLEVGSTAMNARKQQSADAGTISLELDGSAHNSREKKHMRDGAWIGVDVNTGAAGADGKNENYCMEYDCIKAIHYDGSGGATESWYGKSQSHMIRMETGRLRLEQGRVSESVVACVSGLYDWACEIQIWDTWLGLGLVVGMYLQ